MAHDARLAAQDCIEGEHYRSAVSRAYYAMFSAVTGALISVGLEPRKVRGTWPHTQLPMIVRKNLRDRIGHSRAKEIKRLLTYAYTHRTIADYYPGWTVDRPGAQRILADTDDVLRILENIQ
ncbi:MAG: HEPN domain-containing protein [Phycisphaerae bacterium]|nr:HEPN domain-containing protein [Phycisphaerae bacterium]